MREPTAAPRRLGGICCVAFLLFGSTGCLTTSDSPATSLSPPQAEPLPSETARIPVIDDASAGRTPDTEAPNGRKALTFAPPPEGLLPGEGPGIGTEALPYQTQIVAPRPEPLLEIGGRFLGNGPIPPGVPSPTGAALQPSFLLYGEFRSAFQSFDSGTTRNTEWSNRLDLYGDLKLSGTERLVVGLRPIDTVRGNSSGYSFVGGRGKGWHSEFNTRVQTLFLEGDVGEVFPGLDPDDTHAYDYGFTVGRAPLEVQEGLLLDDTVDMVGITRNSLMPEGVANLRITGLFAWDQVHRDDNLQQDGAKIAGLLTQADIGDSTVSADALHVHDNREASDAYYLGLGAVQRIGPLDTTFRLVGSKPTHDGTAQAGGGALLFAELSRTLTPRDDIVYLNAFWSPSDFSSAARGQDKGIAVARTGILFEPVGMGRYGVPLGADPDETVGAALGWQAFLDGIAEQVVLELAGRDSTEGKQEGALGIGARYQRAIGQHHVLRLDAFAAAHESADASVGARAEWRVEF